MKNQLIRVVGIVTVLAQAPLQAQWPEIHNETSPSAQGSDFGWSVAIERDMALVGDPGDLFGAGSAHVYQRIGGIWTYVTTLTGGPFSSRFGASVDLSVAAGVCRAVVGASFSDGFVGAAHFYDCADWSQSQKVVAADSGPSDAFGTSVSIHGDLAAIGAIGNDGFAPTGTNDGAAYVFRYDNGTWKEEAKLAATSPEGGSNLGTSVSISGTRVAAGAPTAGPDNEGAVFVFERVADPGSPSGYVWPQQAKLLANDDDPLDELGRSVSISGALVLAGAPRDDSIASGSGAAYVFRKDLSGWVQDTKIKAFDAEGSDVFGAAVYLSGGWAAVGATGEDEGGFSAGAIYVFEHDNCGIWSHRGKILAAAPAPGAHLGRSVQLGFRNGSAGTPPLAHLVSYVTVLGGASGSAHWFEREIPGYTRECPPRD